MKETKKVSCYHFMVAKEEEKLILSEAWLRYLKRAWLARIGGQEYVLKVCQKYGENIKIG